MPLNLKFVFEGDEEASSPGLDQWLEDHRDQLQADVAVISDTEFFDGNLPAITIALRGIMYAQIDVVGPPFDMHSGGYGGVIQNPANALAWILSSLKSPDGIVRIPGFYDDVVPLTDLEREALAELPFDEESYRQTLGVPVFAGEPGYSVLERRGARPTLDVNGLWSGFQGEGSKTIIPGRAHAKVSCRLVPGQDPRRIFDLLKAHVATVTPPGVTVEVRSLGNGDPSLSFYDAGPNGVRRKDGGDQACRLEGSRAQASGVL